MVFLNSVGSSGGGEMRMGQYNFWRLFGETTTALERKSYGQTLAEIDREPIIEESGDLNLLKSTQNQTRLRLNAVTFAISQNEKCAKYAKSHA